MAQPVSEPVLICATTDNVSSAAAATEPPALQLFTRMRSPSGIHLLHHRGQTWELRGAMMGWRTPHPSGLEVPHDPAILPEVWCFYFLVLCVKTGAVSEPLPGFPHMLTLDNIDYTNYWRWSYLSCVCVCGGGCIRCASHCCNEIDDKDIFRADHSFSVSPICRPLTGIPTRRLVSTGF